MIAVNTQTQQLIDAFAHNPTHALLLTGEEGSGIQQLTQSCIALLAKSQAQKLVTTYLEPDEKGTIGIDAIRELRGAVKHKNNINGISRIVVITAVSAMQHEAQNALLKLLEEPPQGTLFILQVEGQAHVLETIQSRSTRIHVLPISLTQAISHYKAHNPEHVERMFALSGGLAGLLEELLGSSDSKAALAAQRAKEVLGMTLFNKLQLIDKEYKKRPDAELHIISLERVCHAGLATNPHNNRWHQSLTAIVTAKTMLKANVSTKLVLTQLYCSL